MTGRGSAVRDLLVLGTLGAGAYFGYHFISSRWQELKQPTSTTEPTLQAPEVKPPPPQEQPSPPAVGRLDIQSSPAGAKIFLNDQDTGRTTPARLDTIRAGQKWRVGLYLHPYRYWEHEVEVAPEKTVEVRATLEINVGSLEIESLPSGASLWIDGIRQGQTPFSLSKLKPGTVVQLRIEHAGYKSWTGSAEIFAGKTTTVQAVLKRR